jgi:hypothetical protein
LNVPISSLRQERTFIAGELNDRIWSTTAGIGGPAERRLFHSHRPEAGNLPPASPFQKQAGNDGDILPAAAKPPILNAAVCYHRAEIRVTVFGLCCHF